MDANAIVALILGVLTAIPSILLAVATLIQVLRTQHQVTELSRGLNGRLDQLLVEREQRVRAEHLAIAERERLAGLAGLVQSSRPDPIMRQIPPDRPGS